jgi:GGDEF domain-containing protein
MGARDTAVLDDTDLRMEWLRFRSRLYDTLTGLPTLPALLEDVRRMIETCGSAHVVYLDLGRSGWQETQLGWEAYDETVREFSRLLAGVRGHELGEADLFCVDTVRSDRFIVILSGTPGDSLAAALRRADERRKAILTRLREGIAGRPSSSLLQAVRLTEGHAHVQHDPKVRVERAIQQAVTDSMLMSLLQRQTIEAVRLEARSSVTRP